MKTVFSCGIYLFHRRGKEQIGQILVFFSKHRWCHARLRFKEIGKMRLIGEP